MKTVKRLPYGTSNFSNLIDGNFCYVDKTPFIEMLEQEPNSYQFFIRPRKFGKSLFLSTLSHYYDILQERNFSKMFGNLYIGQHPTRKKNSCAVMEFNFSGIDTGSAERFETSFTQNVQRTVRIFLQKYVTVFPHAEELIRRVDDNREGIGSLRTAYAEANFAGVPIFVLIDEYDHFANDLIAMGVNDVYKRMVRANGIVRDFYETLKIGTSDAVDRIFITGISPVMIDDLTSGFNIAANLTPESRYNNMLGFTREEADRLMRETGVNPAYVTVDIAQYYDGYLFHEEASDRIYNPSMLLYFFYQIVANQQIPKNIIDDNLKTDYGRLRRLTQNENNREMLLEIAKDDGIVTDIVTKFSIDHLYNDKYFISLLFYMGLLTIAKPVLGKVRLCIPNYSVKTLYWEYILESIQADADFVIHTGELDQTVAALALEGKAEPFVEYVCRNVFNKLSLRDLRQFDEKYIKIMLLACLFQSRVYVPVSEPETENGYVDLYLQRSPLLPEVKYEWIFELKYIKASDKNLQARRKEAQEQLQRYVRSDRLKNRDDLKTAVILFIGKNKYEIFSPE